MSHTELPKENTLTIMSEDLHHLFFVNGCDPTCHCCRKKIAVNDKFKLATVSESLIIQAKALDGYCVFKGDIPHDVMLCGNEKCTPLNMVLNRINQLKSYKERGLTPYGNSPRTGGCSIINGKIVP